MDEPFPKQSLALKHMAVARHPILVGEHPFSWNKGNSMQYLTFETAENVEEYVQKNRDNAWINEIILPNTQRDLLGAMGIDIPPPRLCFDIEILMPGDGDPVRFAQMMQGVKDTARSVLRRCLRDATFEPGYLDIDSSRKKGKKFKHSVHLIVTNVSLDDWVDGRHIIALMDGRWQETHPDADPLPLDRSVYSRFRIMRVQGSSKAAKELPLTSDHPFTETLITSYTGATQTITASTLHAICSGDEIPSDRKRKRSLNMPIENTDGEELTNGSMEVEEIQRWLDHSPTARSLGWTGARVLRAARFGTRQYIFFKVGFSEKGRPHTCMGGCSHGGNANQTWNIKMDTETCWLESACWPNGKFDLPCQSATRCLLYLPIVDEHKKRVRLL